LICCIKHAMSVAPLYSWLSDRFADLVTGTHTSSLELMSWQMDGRHGGAKVGESQRQGFAMMRDQARHLIAFHLLPNEADGLTPAEPAPLDQFVISEGDFELDAA
jgi:hypothetical protein